MFNMMRTLVKDRLEPGIWMEEVPIPDYISDEVAAIFDPLGNAGHRQ